METPRHKPVVRQGTFDTSAKHGSLTLPVIDTNSEILLKPKGSGVKDISANTHFNKNKVTATKDLDKKKEAVVTNATEGEKKQSNNNKALQISNSKTNSKDTKSVVTHADKGKLVTNKSDPTPAANSKDKTQQSSTQGKSAQSHEVNKSSSLAKAIESKRAAALDKNKGNSESVERVNNKQDKQEKAQKQGAVKASTSTKSTVPDQQKTPRNNVSTDVIKQTKNEQSPYRAGNKSDSKGSTTSRVEKKSNEKEKPNHSKETAPKESTSNKTTTKTSKSTTVRQPVNSSDKDKETVVKKDPVKVNILKGLNKKRDKSPLEDEKTSNDKSVKAEKKSVAVKTPRKESDKQTKDSIGSKQTETVRSEKTKTHRISPRYEDVDKKNKETVHVKGDSNKEVKLQESSGKDVFGDKSPRLKLKSTSVSPERNSDSKHLQVENGGAEKSPPTSPRYEDVNKKNKQESDAKPDIKNSNVKLFNATAPKDTELSKRTSPAPSDNFSNSVVEAKRSPRYGDVSKDRLKTDNQGELTTGTKSKSPIVSPRSSKTNTLSNSSPGGSNLGRISPSNDTVEPIRTESKPETDRSKMNGRESYEHIYAERNTLLKSEYTLKKRIKQLEDEANGFLRAIEELTAENRQLRDQLEQLEGGLHVQGKGGCNHEEKIIRIEKENAELHAKLIILEKENKQKEEKEKDTVELRELKQQIIDLQTENQKAFEDNKRLKKDNEVQNKQIQELEKKVADNEAKANETTKTDKTNELTPEQKQINKSLKEYKAKAQSMEKKVDALEYENKELSSALAQKKDELAEVLGVMKNESKFDDEIKELKSKIAKLTKEKKDIEMSGNKEKRILHEQLQDAKLELKGKSNEFDEMKIKLDQLEKENKKVKSEQSAKLKEIESLQEEVKRLKEENEELRKKLDDLREKHESLLSETNSANKDIMEAKSELEKFNKELQSIVTEKENQIGKLIQQLDSMKDDRDKERKALKEEKGKLAVESKKAEHYQTESQRLEAELKQVVEKLDESKLKDKQTSLQLEDRNFEISNLQQQVFELNVKLDNNSKRINDLVNEKRAMEEDRREWDVKKDKIDDIESSNRRLVEENKRLRSQLEMTSFVPSKEPVRALPEKHSGDNKVLEAWVSDKVPVPQQAMYIQKESNSRRRIHLSTEMQQKRVPYSKSSPVKNTKKSEKRKEDVKQTKSPSRSLEDLRKAVTRTPESEHSLPEISKDARLTVGYGSGYREIHANRIRGATKRVY